MRGPERFRQAEQGRTFGNSQTRPDYVADLCGEAGTLEVLAWVSLSTAVASLLTGAAWLLWIGDGDDTQYAHAVQLRPTFGPDRAALTLHAHW